MNVSTVNNFKNYHYKVLKLSTDAFEITSLSMLNSSKIFILSTVFRSWYNWLEGGWNQDSSLARLWKQKDRTKNYTHHSILWVIPECIHGEEGRMGHRVPNFPSFLSMTITPETLLTHEMANWAAKWAFLCHFIHGAPTHGSSHQYGQVALSNIPCL